MRIARKLTEKCSIEDCDRLFYGRGWCKLHYMRWYKHGTTDLVQYADRAEQFWAKVDKESGPIYEPTQTRCWLWTGNTQRSQGYGRFTFNGKEERAHRVAYFFANGEWPEPFGCHHCDNPPCVRPDHIFAGTPLDNTRDMIAKGRAVHVNQKGRRKKNCHRGHAFTEDNIVWVKANGVMVRGCLICRKASLRAWRERNKKPNRRGDSNSDPSNDSDLNQSRSTADHV